MSREGEFMVYATEVYRAAKALSGRQVAALFDQYGVMPFLMRFFDLLHVQGDANIVAEIDDFIQERQRTPDPADREQVPHVRFSSL